DRAGRDEHAALQADAAAEARAVGRRRRRRDHVDGLLRRRRLRSEEGDEERTYCTEKGERSQVHSWLLEQAEESTVMPRASQQRAPKGNELLRPKRALRRGSAEPRPSLGRYIAAVRISFNAASSTRPVRTASTWPCRSIT